MKVLLVVMTVFVVVVASVIMASVTVVVAVPFVVLFSRNRCGWLAATG